MVCLFLHSYLTKCSCMSRSTHIKRSETFLSLSKPTAENAREDLNVLELYSLSMNEIPKKQH